MRLSVSVPVLSEQITVAQPSVSTAASLRAMARLCAMRCMPMPSVTVTTAGSPSGMAATASAMEVSTISISASPRRSPMAKMTPMTPPAMAVKRLPSPSSWICSGVGPGSASASMPLKRPISVAMPVPVTKSSPRPRVTTVFMKAIDARSAMGASAGAGSRVFATGSDSPDSAASSISSATA